MEAYVVVLSLIGKYFAFISAKLLGFGNTSAITGKSADLDYYLKLQQHPLAMYKKLARQACRHEYTSCYQATTRLKITALQVVLALFTSPSSIHGIWNA